MRPTVEEQLQGTCRILETVVAPCVSDPYARTILNNLIANLHMLKVALPKVAGFVRDDNVATLSLLLTMQQALKKDLVARIDTAAQEGEPDVADGAANEERSQLLRALLAEAVCSPDLTLKIRRSIETHMISRAARAPMRYVPNAPTIITSIPET
jgi:hypothetical protein